MKTGLIFICLIKFLQRTLNYDGEKFCRIHNYYVVILAHVMQRTHTIIFKLLCLIVVKSSSSNCHIV